MLDLANEGLLLGDVLTFRLLAVTPVDQLSILSLHLGEQILRGPTLVLLHKLLVILAIDILLVVFGIVDRMCLIRSQPGLT